MSSFNKVIIMGRLTRDLDLRTTNDGNSMVELGIAINERRLETNGQWVDCIQFVDITFWNRKAEIIAEYFKKGSPILIEGALQLDRWEKDGKKYSKLKVRGKEFSFVGNKHGNGTGNSGEQLVSSQSDYEIPF